MRSRTACLFAVAFALLLGHSALAQTPAPLIGKVSSAEEGLMEGVVISAKKGIVTVSVVSNDKGEFSFPASKLDAGTYALSIKASGYDLTGPSSVTLAAGAPVNLDLKLVKAKNLSAQLTNLEWIESAPGTPDQKRILSRCVNCHGIDKVVNSKYTADEFVDVIKRMATYSNNSFFLQAADPQGGARHGAVRPQLQKEAAYLASVNRSATGELTYPLKTVPRVKGAGTRVVITEYDLPNQGNPAARRHHRRRRHRLAQRLQRAASRPLRPEDAGVQDLPGAAATAGWPTGALDLETDPNGNLWLGLMFQAGAAKFDKKTEQFTMYQLPPAR